MGEELDPKPLYLIDSRGSPSAPPLQPPALRRELDAGNSQPVSTTVNVNAALSMWLRVRDAAEAGFRSR
jgi:hypothetical protein